MLVSHASNQQLPRHRHVEAYAAVVVEGRYIEAGDRGRFTAEAGQVVFHAPYEAHANQFFGQGGRVLNLPLHFKGPPLACVSDPDHLVRLAERDTRAACEYLELAAITCEIADLDWPDALARDLIANPDTELGLWAARNGLAAQSLSRGFRQVFGITPKQFRAEQRARKALSCLEGWQGTGAALAAELGYVDQAHMIKSIRSITGKCPSCFRAK